MDRPRFVRAAALAVTASLALLAACALPPLGRGPGQLDTPGDTATRPIVQVREYTASSLVSVIGWTPDEPAYGLRSYLRRHGGELVGDYRRGDHRLYLSTTLVRSMGGIDHARVPGKGLTLAGGARDDHACFYGDRCSPVQTVWIAIPDSVLRLDRDSLVVTFHPRAAHDWSITLHRDLIDSYLRAVDSVAATLRDDLARR